MKLCLILFKVYKIWDKNNMFFYVFDRIKCSEKRSEFLLSLRLMIFCDNRVVIYIFGDSNLIIIKIIL